MLVIPFCLPGEKVRVRVYRQARLHSFADFLELLVPNEEMRDMSRVKCKYFGRCAGCQYQVRRVMLLACNEDFINTDSTCLQMLSYEKQLELKRDVVVRAYETFSGTTPFTLLATPLFTSPFISKQISHPHKYPPFSRPSPHPSNITTAQKSPPTSTIRPASSNALRRTKHLGKDRSPWILILDSMRLGRSRLWILK